ncbi:MULTISPECIES: carbohydrate kinase [unclassified Exiguobacterium]|uniref:carbohydrate kinase family protein n=1 Tax=unclassified Exiguobacterium TaxID=2644629 RepID=UPI001BE829A8|nr:MULTISPECIES: carbohydrate kinase [unclassified Exiguobacterium]
MKIFSLGEALIDLIPLDTENMTFQKNPGGAPANVSVGLARLGADSYFLGAVGDDSMGHFLKDTLHHYGVRTDHLVHDSTQKTGLVLVTNGQDGERSFEFINAERADMQFHETHVPEDFTSVDLLHIGSISLITGESVNATRKAIARAKAHQVPVSYDPNLRESLWPNLDEARTTIRSVLPDAQIVKLAEEELTFLTGQTNLDDGAAELLAEYPIRLLAITRGSEGSILYTDRAMAVIDAITVDAIDTTGAGDAFMSGLLYQCALRDFSFDWSEDELRDIGRFAAISGGLAASVKGAMAALPTLDEVAHRLS